MFSWDFWESGSVFHVWLEVLGVSFSHFIVRKPEVTKDVSRSRTHKQWRDLNPDLALNLVLFLLCHTCLAHLFVILPMIIYQKTVLFSRIYWSFQESNGGRATSQSITQSWVLGIFILSYFHHWEFITDYAFSFGPHATPQSGLLSTLLSSPRFGLPHSPFLKWPMKTQNFSPSFLWNYRDISSIFFSYHGNDRRIEVGRTWFCLKESHCVRVRWYISGKKTPQVYDSSSFSHLRGVCGSLCSI